MSVQPQRLADRERAEMVRAKRTSPRKRRVEWSNALGLALSGTTLALSGVALAVFRYAPPVGDAFSVYPHPWWRYVVMAHVIAIPIFFFFVGGQWWGHVVRHWKNRKRRVSGAIIVIAVALVSVTGYALYFVGGEQALKLWRAAHAAVGGVGIALYTHHAVAGWRRVARIGRVLQGMK